MILCLADQMLVRTHDRKLLIVCLTIKTFMLYPIELYFYLHPVIDSASRAGMIIYCFWRALVITGTFLWTYSGNDGKTGLGLVICETAAVLITFPALAVLNYIEHRPSAAELSYPFMVLDLLMPLLFWLMWRAVRRPVLFITGKYRAWSPKHSWLLWTPFLIYWFTSTYTDMSSEAMYNSDRHMHTHQLWGIAGTAIMAVWILCQEKQERVRHEYLMKQASLAGTYDRIIERNRTSAAGMQQQIREQMDEISRQVQSGAQVGSDQIKTYLEQLQQEAAELQIEGVYCGNYLVDAVLCMQGEMLEKLGYRKDFECVGVPAEMEDQSLVPQILELIFEEWLEQHEKKTNIENVCRLRITGKGGQLLITANISGRWHAGRRRLMKDLLSEKEGVFEAGKSKREQQTGECIILLPF